MLPVTSRVPLLAALCCLILTATLPALTILAPNDPTLPPLQIKSQIIQTQITGPVARTTLTQIFHNPHNRILEGTFLLPLPKDAQVTDFVMTMNGEKVAAEVLDATQARETYTRIVRQTRDPGLIEYIDARTFRVSIFPIPANGDMPIELSFAQPLKREGGMMAYHFGAGLSGPAVEGAETDFIIEVKDSRPIGTIYSPTHSIKIEQPDDKKGATVTVEVPKTGGSRPFTLLFAPQDSQDVGLHNTAYRGAGEDEGTFLLLIAPPAEGDLAKPVAKTVTFVLDTSGSMNNGKLEQALAALDQCLGVLGKADHFNILTFSTSVRSFRDNPVEANADTIEAAKEFLAEQRPSGGTNISGALDRALSQDVPQQTLHQVVFVTDGLPTIGTTDVNALLKEAQEKNTENLRVFALGVGYDVNTKLLDMLAEGTRAVSSYVMPEQNIEAAVSSFFDTVAYPVLTGLKLKIDGVDALDIYPQELPDLFQGRDLLVLGRYGKAGTAKITLTGKSSAGADYKRDLSADLPEKTNKDTEAIAALWANRKVAYLLDEIRKNGETKELKDEVVELAMKYKLATPYTSFLAVEDSELERIGGGPVLADAFAGGRAMPAPPAGAPMPAESPRFRREDRAASSQFELSAERSVTSRNLGALAFDEAESGEAAVRSSIVVAEQKKAENLAGSSSAASKRAPLQQIGGKTFERSGENQWIQLELAKDLKTVKVKYLSDAWFALLDRFPDMKEAILLGEKVTLHLGKAKVEIGEEGIDDPAKLPESLR